MEDLVGLSQSVDSRESFLEFVIALNRDLERDSRIWTNSDLASFLEGMASWIEDMEGFYVNSGRVFPDKIEWRVFAEILMGARIYE